MKESKQSNNLSTQSEHLKNKELIIKNGDIRKPNDITPKNAHTEQKTTLKKAKTTSKLITAFVAMVSAATLSVGGLSTIFGGVEAKASIESVYCDETSVSCYITIEKFQEGLSVVLYNDFTNRVEKIEMDEEYEEWEEMRDFGYECYFENLAPHMSYTLSIMVDSYTLDSKAVFTKLERKTSDEYPYEQDKPTTVGRN